MKIGHDSRIGFRTGKDMPVVFPDPVPKNINHGESFPNTGANHDNMEEIIGVTVGSIIFIVIVATIVSIVMRKRRNKEKHEVSETVNMRYNVEDAEEKIDMIRPQSFLR